MQISVRTDFFYFGAGSSTRVLVQGLAQVFSAGFGAEFGSVFGAEFSTDVGSVFGAGFAAGSGGSFGKGFGAGLVSVEGTGTDKRYMGTL